MNAKGKHLVILIEPIYVTQRVTDGLALPLSRSWGTVPSGTRAEQCKLLLMPCIVSSYIDFRDT